MFIYSIWLDGSFHGYEWAASEAEAIAKFCGSDAAEDSHLYRATRTA